MHTMIPTFAITLLAALTGCATPAPALELGPGQPSSPTAPEAARPAIAQVLAAADPLQVEVGAGEAKASGHSGHSHHHHSMQHGSPAGDDSSQRRDSRGEPKPEAGEGAPAQGKHAGHGDTSRHSGHGSEKSGGHHHHGH